MSKLPERLSCPECSTEKGRIIHWAVGAAVDEPGEEPSGPWFWELQNHDKTSMFEWPYKFDSKDAAWAHIHSILREAQEAAKGDDVV
jgi:hypothetical protein